LPAIAALERVKHLAIGPARACNGLAVHPLFAAGPDADLYLTLDEALAAGTAHVTEVSEGGHVPELRFRNDGDRPVLLLDGEELVGAKQNRVLNLTILAPARSEIVIPVSCVEHGRWAWRSRKFSAANRTLYAKARRSKMEQVSFSLKQTGERRSDQSAIWADIARKSARMEAFSDTGAASAMYERRAADLEEFVQGIAPEPGQVGAVFLIAGRVAGIELFGSAKALAKLYPKLVRSYGLDAIDEDRRAEGGPGEAGPDPKALLAEVAAARAERHKAVGLGEDLRLEAPSLVGAALVDGPELVHLCAFARGFG
jgi:hypothetical protein